MLQCGGKVRRGVPDNDEFLYAAEHMEKVQPLCDVHTIARWSDIRFDFKGSHAGEEGGYLLADVGYQGQLKSWKRVIQTGYEPA